MRQPAGSRWLLPLALALLAVGCGDGGTDPDELTYRPWQTVSRMGEVVDPVLSADNALLGLSAAGEALTQFATESTAALLTGPLADVRSGPGALRATRSSWSAQLSLPPAIVGETLVWDVEGEQYVVDEGRADAPEGGVRVVYYAVDPATGRPAEPLLALGHVDLTDEDVTDEERLGIRVVDTTEGGAVVLLEYTVGYRGESQESEGDARFTGLGLHTGPAFDLVQAFTWSEAQNSDALALDYLYTEGEASVRLRLSASSAFEAPAWEEVALRVDVLGGAAEDVAVEVDIGSTGALDGEIRVGGVRAVLIGGVDGDPAFSDADGRALSAVEVESLRELWSLVSDTLDVSNALMGPAALLLLPG